jgi:outer membrane protein assembly factor BamA
LTRKSTGRSGRFRGASKIRVLLLLAVFLPATVQGNTAKDARIEDYEGRQIVAIELVFEGSTNQPAAETEFLSLLRIAPNTPFSAVRVRESLQALFDSGRVANARVEVFEEGTPRSGPVRLRFVVQRQIQIGDVRIELGTVTGTPISAEEIRSRLNFAPSGNRLSRQLILRNADEIQVYMRDHGYFNATVEADDQVGPRGLRATVTYRVTPGEQSLVDIFNIGITGFDPATVRNSLALQPGVAFTRDALAADVKRVRDALIAAGYLSPLLEDARVEREPETNRITVHLTGAVGPKVNVVVENYEFSESKKRELLPVLREGNIDYSAIVEGARRLRNELQEDGYFFAEITQKCTVSNPPPGLGPNGTEETCQNLNPEPLSGRTATIAYKVEQGRRFRLNDIRITGTERLSFEDVESELRSQKASALGLIPFWGYGRGYTSVTLLEQDRRTVEAFMRDLGYRSASVQVLQGVSIDGENRSLRDARARRRPWCGAE